MFQKGDPESTQPKMSEYDVVLNKESLNVALSFYLLLIYSVIFRYNVSTYHPDKSGICLFIEPSTMFRPRSGCIQSSTLQ